MLININLRHVIHLGGHFKTPLKNEVVFDVADNLIKHVVKVKEDGWNFMHSL